MALTLQQLLDQVALVVGGTADPNTVGWYSGLKAGDGTGIQAVTGDPPFCGCWSNPPEALGEYPIGVLMADGFTSPLGVQGNELDTDRVTLYVFVGRIDSKAAHRVANNYRDLVPAQFAAHLQLAGNALSAWPVSGDLKEVEYAGISYIAWEFKLEVERYIVRTYVA